VYLLHAPVHYTVDAVMAATGHPLRELSVSQARVAMGLTVLAVIALAALAHRWIEVPMRRWVLRALPAPDRRVVTRTVG
jgi:peptidoglycan/LPS O-acetylase OafA/YrhL